MAKMNDAGLYQNKNGTWYYRIKMAADANGNPVKPEQPNGYKFEQLVLDMIHDMETCLPYEVVREKEFAPIKNKEGIDSVESARALLEKNGVTLQ